MEPNEPLCVEAEGITVTKRYEPDDFAVPTIGFEIRSERNTAVEVRLEERLPEEYPVEGVGFHPEYDSERWTAHSEGRLVFESALDPGTTLVTVYGVRIVDDEDSAAFMTEPELAVRPIDAEEPDAAVEVIADGAGDAMPVTVTRVENGTADSNAESVAAALAAELRSGSVSAADRETLRELVEVNEPERERVRIDHLQARVSDLEAYSDAFEAFLDENGTGERLVEELQAGVDDLRGEVAAIDAHVEEAIDRRNETIDALESDLAALEETIEDRNGVAADVDAVGEDLDALYDEVDELRTWRDQVGMAFGSE